MTRPFLDTMDQLKHQAKTGAADLKLSVEVRDAYVNAINDFRAVLQEQWAKINGLPAYGDAGWFASAHSTRTNLEHAREELKRVLSDYDKYLAEFSDTVREAAGRLIKSG